MKPYSFIRLLWLLAVGNLTSSYAQSSSSLIPVPAELKQAVSLDLGGNTPLIGVSYHQQLVRFTDPAHARRASLDFAVGAGYIPSICLFTCSRSSFTTYHTLLLRWGRKLQGEVGYAGTLMAKDALVQQAYLPGAITGLRITKPRWFLRVYMAGLFYHEDETLLTSTGEVLLQRTNRLALFTGVSIAKRF